MSVKIHKISTVKKDSGKFLHLYNLETEIEIDGIKQTKKYEMISRRSQQDGDDLVIEGNYKPDGVIIVATCNRKLVVVREYRYAIGQWVWSLPAGLVDAGESEVEAAYRELYEETCLILDKKTARARRNTLSSPGMSDELLSFVYCEAKGTPGSNKHALQWHRQNGELIETHLMGIKELNRLRNTEELISSRLAPIVEMYCLISDSMQNFLTIDY